MATTANSTINRASGLAKDAGGRSGQKVANVSDVDIASPRDRVQHGLRTAKAALTAGRRQIGATARHAAAATDDYVRSSPWQSLGMAALAGMACGFLLARR